MRLRVVVVAMVVLTALSAVPAGAGKPRRAMLPYTLEDKNHGVSVPGHQAGAFDGEDAYVFALERGENAVSVMVLDDREGDVAAVIAQRVRDGGVGGASYGHFATYETICTETEAPVRVRPDIDVDVFLQKGTCDDGTPSMPTSGDIVVDFHKISR
jgi:hypothetical protein